VRNPLEFWYNTPMSIKKVTTRIMVFGTFDGVHKGHQNFFKQARILASKPFLIVSIARDKNVFKIKNKFPNLNEQKRVLLVKKFKLVDKVVLAGAGKHIPHIIKEHPDIIALGYDQNNYVKNLKKDLKNKGLNVKIVRLKPYKKHIYKNHLLKKKR
jgi:FAD synthetase